MRSDEAKEAAMTKREDALQREIDELKARQPVTYVTVNVPPAPTLLQGIRDWAYRVPRGATEMEVLETVSKALEHW